MDLLEVVHLCSLTAGLMAIIAHANNMAPGSVTRFERCAWWMLGVGYFGEWYWQLYWLYQEVAYYVPPEHILTTLGVTALIVINARPEWRPLFADRRRKQRPVPNELRRNS